MRHAVLFSSLALALVTSLLGGMSIAQAQNVGTPSSQPPAAVPATANSVSGHASYSELKAQCLKETPSLKGHELRKCVKAKKQALK